VRRPKIVKVVELLDERQESTDFYAVIGVFFPEKANKETFLNFDARAEKPPE